MREKAEKLIYLKDYDRGNKLIKTPIYIEERYDDIIGELSNLTEKEPSLLVNEAIILLIQKYKTSVHCK